MRHASDAVHTQPASPRRAPPDGGLARVGQVYALPPLPIQAQAILRLAGQPESGIDELRAVVDGDSALRAQLVRCARILSGGDAPADAGEAGEMLGFPMAWCVALGFSAGRAFSGPAEGPLGTRAFWHHAAYSAALVHDLASSLPPERRPDPGLAYMTGLVHDFGFLLLGHLFPPEFRLLNRLCAARPRTPITTLERQVLGMGQARACLRMGHGDFGAWLMQAWGMPEAVVTTLCRHHEPGYDGPHAVYPNLVLIADALLDEDPDVEGGDGLGEAHRPVLARLGLRADDTRAVRDRLVGPERRLLDEVADEQVA